jgi:hypothetical protein
MAHEARWRISVDERQALKCLLCSHAYSMLCGACRFLVTPYLWDCKFINLIAIGISRVCDMQGQVKGQRWRLEVFIN